MKSVDWRWIYLFVADVARFFRPYTCEKIKKPKKHWLNSDKELNHLSTVS